MHGPDLGSDIQAELRAEAQPQAGVHRAFLVHCGHRLDVGAEEVLRVLGEGRGGVIPPPVVVQDPVEADGVGAGGVVPAMLCAGSVFRLFKADEVGDAARPVA